MADLQISNLQSRVPGLLVQQLAALTICLRGAEITGLNGPSGSGKSLLLRSIADLDPSEGEVSLSDCPRASMAAHQWREKVAYLPTDSAWWFETVGEHFHQVDIPCLQKLGFDADVMDWKINRISSGEKQRLALARCLSREPQTLLLDEPTASLDAAHTSDVEQIVMAYMEKNDAPVLWISHDLNQLKRLATRILSIEDSGDLRELKW